MCRTQVIPLLSQFTEANVEMRALMQIAHRASTKQMMKQPKTFASA